jgi:glycerol uptake facilitator-like aquaporin
MPSFDLRRRLFAETLGTAFLLATVVGSGIMGERLASGIVALALLGNTLATGAILVVLILIFGPISGAHIGVVAAHLMFQEPLLASSTNLRSGASQWFAEFVATFGLIATILGCLRWRPEAVAYGVGLFISAGYWFTSSTSFANPAVTLARAFTDTFSGIRPLDAPGFIAAQLVAALVVTLVFRWLLGPEPEAEAEPRPVREGASEPP